MAETISFSFTPNKSDYMRTLRAFSFRQRSTRVLLIFMLLLSLCSISSVMLNSFALGFFAYGFIFPIITLFYILSVFFTGPAGVANKVEKNERLRCETSWQVDEHKISIKDKFAEIKFEWGAFGRVFETDAYFLMADAIYKNMYRFIPKRAFQSEVEQDRFRKMLTEKVSPITSIRSINLPEMSFWASRLVVVGFFFILIVIIVVINFLHTIGN